MRAVPDDNLCFPVSIELSDGSFGSGFLLNTGPALFLGTAKHVLFDKQNSLVANSAVGSIVTSDLINRATLDLDLSTLEARGAIRPHATADVAVIKLADRGALEMKIRPRDKDHKGRKR